MGKKRKSRSTGTASKPPESKEYAVNETFDNSEDEFYTHRDKILLDEAPAAKRQRRLEEEAADLEPSDEEVYAYEDLDDAEDEVDESDDELKEQEQDGEDERIWGSSRRDYYNADAIETEADALEEEAEARRLQQKQLKNMTEADFGFDETQWATEAKSGASRRPVVEKLPPVQIPANATKEDLLKILRTRYPEVEPLAEDLVNLHPLLQELQAEQKNSALSVEPTSDTIRLRALSAYLATISMFIAILTCTKDSVALPPAELREHPIMASLLRCRQLWDAVKDLEDLQEEPVKTIAENPPVVLLPKKTKETVPRSRDSTSTKPSKTLRVEPTELSDASIEEYQQLTNIAPKKVKAKHANLKDIMAETLQSTANDQGSDFGDEDPLTHEQAAEKARKKKSLRFYTSQIAQKTNKRNAASRGAGGDDDVPYKERSKDRQARLEREAERRKQEPIDEEDDDGDDTELVREINDDSNDYYNQVVSKSQAKKVDKVTRASALAEAAKQGQQVYTQEEVGPDGKRRITYAIAKNKGLMPKRKKEVRNPRVKKKMRYEAKMKKLGSMRPVWKGGEAKGGYGGELTGIKTNVVKSVKL